MACPITLGDHN